MNQAGVVAFAKEFQEPQRRVHVGVDRIAQIGIEFGQAGAVDHQVERAGQALPRRRVQTKPCLADVALDDLNPLAQEGSEIMPVAFVQRIEGRRLFDKLFEAPLCCRRPAAANQQGDLADAGKIRE